MKIGTIIALVFVIAGIVLSILASLYWYSTAEDILQAHVIRKLESTAESRADHVETYLKQNIERLNMITSKTVLREKVHDYSISPSEELRTSIGKILIDQKKPLEELERICIVGLDGIIVSSTNSDFIGKDIGDKEFFFHGKEDTVIHFVTEGGEMKMFVTGPFVLDGEVVGVGLTVVDSSYLEGIVRKRTGLGNSGEVLIAIKDHDSDKRVYLFDRLFEEDAVSQDAESEETAMPIKMALEGKEGILEYSFDYRNEPVLAVTQYIENEEVGLVAKIDIDEALGEQRRILLRSVIFIVLGVTISVFIVSIFLARFLSKSLKSLSEDVDKITKGSLDIQLGKSKINEVQKLTDSLNRILASLKLAIMKTGVSGKEIGLGDVIEAKDVAEEKYKALYQTSRDAIMILEAPDWNFTAGNPATVKMFGAKDEAEFLSKTPGDLSPKKQPNGKLSSVLSKAMTVKAMKEGSSSFSWTHKRINGEDFPATILLTKFRLKGKDVLQASVRDLTGKKIVSRAKTVKPVVKKKSEVGK